LLEPVNTQYTIPQRVPRTKERYFPFLEPRSRSQSEQPATCPICYAVIRQSRNLRRHLELRHFAKPGVKKEKKSKSGNDTTLDSSMEMNTTAEGDNTVGSDGAGGAGSAGGQSSGTTPTRVISNAPQAAGAPAILAQGVLPQQQQQQQLQQQHQQHLTATLAGGGQAYIKHEGGGGGGTGQQQQQQAAQQQGMQNVIHIVGDQVFIPQQQQPQPQ